MNRFGLMGASVAALVGCGGSGAPHGTAAAPAVAPELRGMAACTTEGAPGVAEQAAAMEFVESDPARAAQGSEQACELGNPCGCYSLAYALQTGSGVAVDTARARQLFERACTDQLPSACANVASFMLEGTPSPEDEARAERMLADACEAEVSFACNLLGLRVARSREREDIVRAMQLYGAACDGGEAWACHNLANEIVGMTGSPESISDAHQLYVHACEQHVPPACVAVGRAHASGRAVAADPAAAVPFYEQGCEGDAWGCTFLGQALLLGVGITRDEERGKQLLTTACTPPSTEVAPNAVACTQLGVIATGEERATLLTRACELGDHTACDLRAGPPRSTAMPEVLHFDDASFGGLRVTVEPGAVETRSEAYVGGDIDVATLGLRPACVGRIPAEPIAIVTVGRRVPRVRFVAESNGDSTIVVRDPQGVFHCADDMPAGVYHAEVVLPGRAGDYQVWLGSLQQYVAFGSLVTSSLPAEARR